MQILIQQEDNVLTGRNEQHHLDQSVIPLSNPDSNLVNGPNIVKTDTYSGKTFIKSKSILKQKTVQIQSSIKKLKEELVQRARATTSLVQLAGKNEYSSEFNISRFLKFFMYHLVFFGFGPLTLLLICCIDNMILAHNLGFTFQGPVCASAFFQYLFWLNDVYLTIMWGLYYFRPDLNWLGGIYQEQIYFFILSPLWIYVRPQA
ncbi:hypothetical protein FGO68_gene2318 [Halteria grandinella]|uniref:Uncharacterized protein n=1 Tax=Halteria grandinella TaxID=5974 RepID=A0A8J8NVL4_HALGN|nr:hypothetical protein FGO68_gene2318 [Halteria grandinella]